MRAGAATDGQQPGGGRAGAARYGGQAGSDAPAVRAPLARRDDGAGRQKLDENEGRDQAERGKAPRPSEPARPRHPAHQGERRSAEPLVGKGQKEKDLNGSHDPQVLHRPSGKRQSTVRLG